MLHHFRNVPLVGAALLALLAMAGIVFALSWRAADQARLEEGRRANCLAIERHKAIHREDAAFDEEETEEILRELGIDPDSEQGEHLIDRSRENAAREQARFAATPC